MLNRVTLMIALVVSSSSMRVVPDTPEKRVKALVQLSQAVWEDELERVRVDFQADPALVVRSLVGELLDGTMVHGLREESSFYSVCGNALTVLEDLTELRLDDDSRDWIGFRVHDHRSERAVDGAVRARWQAWLRSREGLPVEQWFHGVSARELFVLQRLLRTPSEKWTAAEVEPARTLGPRANAFLLHALLDQEHACEDERVADQANRLLALLNGGAPEPVTRHALLSIDPNDPLRRDGIALVENRIGLRVLHERWSVRLLTSR